MWKWLKKVFKGWFSKDFIHPVFDTTTSTMIDSKLKVEQKKRTEITDKYEQVLANLVYTYFMKKYDNKSDMEIAFNATNKEWKKICRKVNSTEPLLNLNNKAFEIRVKMVVDKLKEEKTNTK